MSVGVSSCEEALTQRGQLGRLRTLRSVEPLGQGQILVDGRRLVNFASNDYLGLSSHPILVARAKEFIDRFGVGSTASRLVCGNLSVYEGIERKIAEWKGFEAALVLPTGFQANATLLPALARFRSLIACDRLSHNSIMQGALASSAAWLRFAHNDLSHLRRRFADRQADKFHSRWIVTESVFSMNGDIADLPGLAEFAGESDSWLYVDEAHATGVLGNGGMGLCSGVDVDCVAVGTFGKALGSFGAYVACSQSVKDYLVNFCGGIIYSTGLSPAVLGAIDAALEIVPGMNEERAKLQSSAKYFRTCLGRLGMDTAGSVTHIVPVVVGSDAEAVSLARFLEARGFFAPAIRPPTVPDGKSRVRFSLTVSHHREVIETLVAALGEWHEQRA